METSDKERCSPPEMRKKAAEINCHLLPNELIDLFEETYKNYLESKKKKESTSENCLKVYFQDLTKKYKPSMIWSIYSKLKSTIQIYEKI